MTREKRAENAGREWFRANQKELASANECFLAGVAWADLNPITANELNERTYEAIRAIQAQIEEMNRK